MRRFARNRDQEPEPEETEREQLRREPLPVARAILWKPLPDSYHLLASMMRAPEQHTRLFISQRAFLQVERHLRSAPDLELGGFLAGHLCECPRSRARYSVVNTVVPFADVSEQAIGTRVTPEAYNTVRRRLDAHRLALIGWYRNGSGLGLQLLPDDVETHLAYFNEPWQTTMLVLPDPSKPKGAFFTYDPRVGRGYCIPFYELFDAHAVESKRLERTCVSWTTYVPSMPVQPLAAGDREIVETTVMPMRSEPEPEPSEPIDEWLDAIKDPWVRLKDVAAGATRRDVPLPLVYESAIRAPDPIPIPIEPPTHPPASTEERRAPDKVEMTPRPTVVAPQKESPKPEPTRPVPPFAGPAGGPSARPALARPASARTAAERPASKPRPISPAAVAAMQRAAAPRAVALPPDFYDDAKPWDFYDDGKQWKRWRRIGFAVAAAAFLAAIVLSSVRSRSERVAQAATSAVMSEAELVPVVSANENGGAAIPLSSAVDSLSGALASYRAIADDHRQGRVGCRVLDRAYALVGRARTHVDSARRQVAGELGDADSIRVSMLGAEYTYVAQTYRRSGCQS
jgi:hypothetical protein